MPLTADVEVTRFFCIPLVIIICIGVPANIISYIIWSRGTKCRSTACSVYFKLLAISDLLVLLIPAPIDVINKANVGAHFLPNNVLRLEYLYDFVCKCYNFSFNFFPQVSAWITTSLTIERTISICFPLKLYRTNASKRAYIVMSVIVLAGTALNVPELIYRSIAVYDIPYQYQGINGTFTYQVCKITSTLTITTYISFIIFTSSLPFITLTVCNIIILVKLCTSLSARSETRQRSIRNMTKITVCVSIVQCVSNIPRAIYEHFNMINVDGVGYNYIEFAFICFYLNNGVNWIMYCLIGHDFREDLKDMCKKCRIGCGSSNRDNRPASEGHIISLSTGTSQCDGQ